MHICVFILYNLCWKVYRAQTDKLKVNLKELYPKTHRLFMVINSDVLFD